MDSNYFYENLNTKIWEKVARANWMPFKKARKYVHELKLNSSREWTEYCQSGQLPSDIPFTPNKIYERSGWRSWGDWLGTNYIYYKGPFLPLEEAKEYVQKLNIKGKIEWKRFIKSRNRPNFLPAKPEVFYEDKGWLGWGDFLGTGNRKFYIKKYLSFEEAKAYVHTLKLKNTKEWKIYCRSGKKPENIPSAPEKIYKDKGWNGHIDWLGTGNADLSIKGSRKYSSYREVKKVVHTLNLNSKEDWEIYIKAKGKPYKLPPRPHDYYKNHGWISWEDWLGVKNDESILEIDELETSDIENN